MYRTARLTTTGLVATLALAGLALTACSEKTTTGAAGSAAPAAARQAESVQAQQVQCPKLHTGAAAESTAPEANFRPSAPRNVRALWLGSNWFQVTWDAPTTGGPYGVTDYVLTSRNTRTGVEDSQGMPAPRNSSTMIMNVLVPSNVDPYEAVVIACDQTRAGTASDPVPYEFK